jgi:hypothetical protein
MKKEPPEEELHMQLPQTSLLSLHKCQELRDALVHAENKGSDVRGGSRGGGRSVEKGV